MSNIDSYKKQIRDVSIILILTTIVVIMYGIHSSDW